MPQKLGQNFLVNKNVIEKIIKSANLRPSDFVLEIGPGKGILTEELAKYAGKVVAVEIDRNLVEILKNKFKSHENVEIVEEDILKINLSELLQKYFNCHSERAKRVEESNEIRSLDKLGMTNCNYQVIANLPYYITSPIIRMFLETELHPAEIILMVQKEVAERIVSELGKMSILSVAVQYYAKPELLFYVSKKNFEPVPEVDSAIIRITPYSSSPYSGRGIKGEGENSKRFFRVVRAGFCAKRKTLANNLANSFHLDKKIVEEKLRTAGTSPTARAQELSVEKWKKLARLF